MNQRLPKLLLSLGLAFVFFYAGIASLLQPENWVGFVPTWLDFDKFAFLKMYSIFEITLAIWLLVGWELKIAAGLTIFVLLGILIVSGLDEITFRDGGLLTSALALYLLARQ